MVAFLPGGKRAFTANVAAGTVSVLDVPGGKKVRDVELAKGIEGIGLRPDGKQLWVLNRGKDEAAVIDAGTLALEKTLPTPKLPFRVAFTPDNATALVACPVAGEVAVFDTTPPRERRRIAFAGGAVAFDTPGPPPGPLAVAVRPDGRVAYATVHVSDAVAVIDLEKMAVIGKIAVGAGPDGIAYSPLDLDPAPKGK
jgi:YVTN family beta-propeller protein